MPHELTEGALARICAQPGEVHQNVIVQILGHKGINQDGDQERFRLLLSDGKWSYSFCLLRTKHNERLHNKELEMFTIMKLTKVVCNKSENPNANQNIRAIFVLEFDVVASGAEVGYKIGSPIALASDGSARNNQNTNLLIRAADNQNANLNVGAALKRPADLVVDQPPIKINPPSYQPQQRSFNKQDDIEKIEAVEASLREAAKLRENQIQAEIAGTEQLLKETQNTLDKQKQQLEEHKAKSEAEMAEMHKKKEDLKTMMRERGNDNDSLGNLVPECPVCYERMRPPMQIYTCKNGHVICSVCKEKVEEIENKCINRCGAIYAGRATAMEQMIRQILGFM